MHEGDLLELADAFCLVIMAMPVKCLPQYDLGAPAGPEMNSHFIGDDETRVQQPCAVQ